MAKNSTHILSYHMTPLESQGIECDGIARGRLPAKLILHPPSFNAGLMEFAKPVGRCGIHNSILVT